MRRPNPWGSRAGLRIEAAESGARGGKSRGRHLHCVCFSCLQISPFFARPYKRQRLRPQIGRRRLPCVNYRTSNENRWHFSAPHVLAGIRRTAAYASLARRAVIFCASIQKGSAFVHKSVGGAALRLFYRTSKEKRWHFSAPHVSVGIRRISAYSPLMSRA